MTQIGARFLAYQQRANVPVRFACTESGCPETTETGGKCFRHRQQREQERGTTKERGYDGAWRKFREWFVARHPLCEDCLELNRETPTEEVHHKIKIRVAPHLRLVASNCRALCKPCHKKRSDRGE